MRYAWPILLALGLAGCSNGDSSSSFSQASVPPNRVVSGRLVARLDLGEPVAGADVELQGTDGTSLERGTTDASGTVYLHASALPPAFRLVARPRGTAFEFAREIRGYAGDKRVLTLNVPTTLVSLDLRSRGGSLEEVEARIKAALRIPQEYDLADGLEESPRSPFSHLAFFRAAGQQGGFAKLIGRPDGAYILTPAQLSTPVQGLEPGLAEIAEETRTTLASYLVFSGESVRFTPSSSSAASSAIRSRVFAETEGGQYLSGVTQGITGNLITGLFGFIAHQLGFNDGTQRQLDQIQSQLQSIQTQLNQFQTDYAIDQYKSSAQFVAGNVSTITSNINSLANSTATITNQPQTSANPFLTGIAALNATTFQACTNVLAAPMLGLSPTDVVNMIVTASDFVVAQVGLDRPPQMQNVPLRTNNLLDSTLQTYSTYFGYQVEGLNLISETAHRGDGSDPVGRISAAVPVVDAVTVSLKQQRQQQPIYLPRDDVVVDLEFGLMWYAPMQSQQTYQNAKSFAAGLTLQGTLPDGTTITYDDWRLPTWCEMQALQIRGTYCNVYPATSPNGVATIQSGYAPGVAVNSHNQYPDPGQATAGLPGLGFLNVATALGSGNNLGSLWFQPWDQDTMYNQFDELRNSYAVDNTPSDMVLGENIDAAMDNPFVQPFDPAVDLGEDAFTAFHLNETGKDSIDSLNNTDNRPFLVCRSLGAPILTPWYKLKPNNGQDFGQNSQVQSLTSPIPTQQLPGLKSEAGGPSLPQQPPVPPITAGTALVAGEYACLGAPTAIAAPNLVAAASPVPLPAFSPLPSPQPSLLFGPGTVVPIPSQALQVATNVTYTVNLGGKFSVGNGTTASGLQSSYMLPSVTESASVTTLGPGGLPNSLADLISFTSSNSSILRVFNVPGLQGVAVPYATSAVTVTAQVLGAGATNVSWSGATNYTSTAPFTPGTVSPHMLTSIQITPRNQSYGTNFQPLPTGAVQIFLTGYYADMSVASLAGNANVTWSVGPTNSTVNATITQGTNPDGSLQGTAFLFLTASNSTAPNNNFLNITATYRDAGGTVVNDTTQIVVVPPFGNP